MPAADAPLRGDARYYSYRERFHQLRNMFSREISEQKVILSRLEKSLPKPNYTITTLTALSGICPEKPVVVIGADQAANLGRWHRSAELLRDFEFLVFARRGSDVPENLPGRFCYIRDFDENISATEIRNKLRQPKK
jgi:nicotinic acid mononucleotide adenylyltransferase